MWIKTFERSCLCLVIPLTGLDPIHSLHLITPLIFGSSKRDEDTGPLAVKGTTWTERTRSRRDRRVSGGSVLSSTPLTGQYSPDTTHGTAIYADQLTPKTTPTDRQTIYMTYMECLGSGPTIDRNGFEHIFSGDLLECCVF